MSKLEELIQQYCPDGVEFYPIHELFEMRNGYTPSTSNDEFWDGGEIPWFKMEDLRAQGKILSESIMHITPKAVKGKGLFRANSIIVATSATIGEHALILVEHLSNQRFTNLYPFQEFEGKVNMFFMNYYFDIVDNWCKAHTNQSSFASVDMEQFRNYSIPVPPLPVQEEIVRILDTFTELQAELQAELQKRKQQYEAYRDKLLNFNNITTPPHRVNVKWKKLGDVAITFKGAYITQKGSTAGSIPVVLGGQEPAYYIDNANHIGEIVAVSRSGASAGFVSYWNEPIYITDGFGFEADTSILTHKYLYYALKRIESSLQQMKRGGGVPHVSHKELILVEIPIPSLAVQQKIVDTLDRFDTLTNDLTAGLPAEIEKRKQQYEYYRDKLLTFKRLNA